MLIKCKRFKTNKLILCTLFLLVVGCSNKLPSNVFLDNPASQNVNNLFDINGDKKSDLVFWSPYASSQYLKPSYFKVIDIFGRLTKIKFGSHNDFPVIGYFDDNGLLDFAVVHTNFNGSYSWHIRGDDSMVYSISLGKDGDYPVSSDVDGDGKTDVIVYEKETNSFNGYFSRTGGQFSYRLGRGNVIPVSRDYDGDGYSDLATYNLDTGVWKIRLSKKGMEEEVILGGKDFLPIPSDYNGDGKCDLLVWNYKNNKLDIIFAETEINSRDSLDKITKTLGKKKYYPVSADYDGNKVSEIAFWDDRLNLLITFDISSKFSKRVYRFENLSDSKPVNNYILNQFIDKPTNQNNSSLVYFSSGMIFLKDLRQKSNFKVLFNLDKKDNVIPYLADFDGDKKNDVCLWSNTGAYLCNSSRADIKYALPLGLSDDVSLVAHFNLDKIADLAVYRQSEKKLFIRYLGTSAPKENLEFALTNIVSAEAIPFVGDVDGNLVDDLLVFDPHNDQFVIKDILNNTEKIISFDGEKILPIVGDFNGDDLIDPAIYDLKKQKLLFSNHNVIDSLEISVNNPRKICAVKIDGDNLSDIFSYNERGELKMYLSTKSYIEEGLSLSDNMSKLVNCPQLYL